MWLRTVHNLIFSIANPPTGNIFKISSKGYMKDVRKVNAEGFGNTAIKEKGG